MSRIGHSTVSGWVDRPAVAVQASIMGPKMQNSIAVGRRRARRSVSARQRRRLVGWLRLTAQRRRHTDSGRYRCTVLLYDRLDAIRADLLQIAAMLECADDPDPECVAELNRLLRDGCDSPLYNRDVHPSELRATLYYAQQALAEYRWRRDDSHRRSCATRLERQS
jgi:hypothetical protein